MDDKDEFIPVLYPYELWLAEQLGWVRGRHYVVYKCLTCLKDMDECEGKRKQCVGRKPTA